MRRKNDHTTTCAPTRAPAPALLAQWAFEALVDEALLTPKPGLIDLRSQHAHHDMSLALMCRSAHTLRPWFEAMAHSALQHRGLFTWRARLGALGREAEHAMLDATGGVNTHRGAIWALGLLVAAANRPARTGECSGAPCGATGSCNHGQAHGSLTTRHTPSLVTITRQAAQLARCPDRFAPAQPPSKGAIACTRYRVNGAKGQAQAGFPHVTRIGLPTLQHRRNAGHNEQQARLDTLLALITTLDDTCLLSRAGPTALARMQAGARQVLQLGGSATTAGRTALTALNTVAKEQRLSPGGAADLLAATLFLDRLDHHFSSRPALQGSTTKA